MKPIILNLLVSLFIALFGFESLAKTYYVSPTGSDNNSGTSISAPWKSALKALRASLLPGDIVYFRGGSYIITGNGMSVRSSGTATAPITFASYPNEIAIIVNDRKIRLTDPTLHSVIYSGASNIVFDRIQIRQTEASRSYTISAKETSTGFSLWGSNIKIKNCVIDNVSGIGVFVNGSKALVENCKIKNHRSHSLYIAGADGEYRNNYLDSVRGSWNSRAIQIQYATSMRNKIHKNLVLNGQAGGVVFSGGVTYNQVYNNIFINNGAKLDTGFGTYGTVLDFWHEKGLLPGAGNKFYNNTVMGKRPNSGLINSSGDGAKVEVVNNIFRTTLAATVGGSAGMKISNNVFYNVTGTVPSGNSKSDPKLVNPAGLTAASAKILAGSSALNTGVDTGLRVDYFGTARPRGSRLDIGAYEY